MKQETLFKFSKARSHGGSNNKGKRKGRRPLDKKRLHHVVMKSELAKGSLSFKNLTHRRQLEQLIYDKAHRYGIRIAEFANVGNHFHLLIRFQNDRLLKNFFKVTMGLIARIVTKAQKNKKFGRFWDGLVFTRIVSKGFDEVQIFDYVEANKVQSEMGKSQRDEFLKKKKAAWKSWRKKKL